MSTPEPGELLALAREVAGEAARLVLSHREAGVEVAHTKSSSVDVVTEADGAAERMIRERLAAARPDDAVLGEEGDDVAGTTGVRWIVDPIDGTVNFLYGIPQFAVSVAAEVDGVVVAGVVFDAATGAEFAASRGGGATRDGVPLRVRPTPPLGERLVMTGFGYRAEVREHQAACVAAMLPRVRDIRRLGSCSLDLCHLAAGEGDAYVEEGPNLWDHAAGALVLTEAGGRFELFEGRFGQVLVGSPADGFEDFLTLVRECGFTPAGEGSPAP